MLDLDKIHAWRERPRQRLGALARAAQRLGVEEVSELLEQLAALAIEERSWARSLHPALYCDAWWCSLHEFVAQALDCASAADGAALARALSAFDSLWSLQDPGVLDARERLEALAAQAWARQAACSLVGRSAAAFVGPGLLGLLATAGDDPCAEVLAQRLESAGTRAWALRRFEAIKHFAQGAAAPLVAEADARLTRARRESELARLSRAEGFGWRTPIRLRFSLSSDTREAWIELALEGDGSGVCWGVNLSTYVQRHAGPRGSGVGLDPSFLAVVDVREVGRDAPACPEPVVDRAAEAASLPGLLARLQRERDLRLSFGGAEFERWAGRV